MPLATGSRKGAGETGRWRGEGHGLWLLVVVRKIQKSWRRGGSSGKLWFGGEQGGDRVTNGWKGEAEKGLCTLVGGKVRERDG